VYDLLLQLDRLQRRKTIDLESSLELINRLSVDSTPGADYAGITLVEAGTEIQTFGPTHPYLTWLDTVQQHFAEGPCLSDAWREDFIHIEDLTSDDRWPHYREAALARTPVRSVLSYRLFLHQKRMATLNFCSKRPHAFDAESIEIGQVFAAYTTVAWNALIREEQFRGALINRDIIGQAKGMLMERFNIDGPAAFELLRRLSQQSNDKLSDIARKLTTIEETTSPSTPAFQDPPN
jgi:hypothetical protein